MFADRSKLAMAPADHPMRPSKNFMVVLSRRLFARSRPVPVAGTVPLPELRWAESAGEQGTKSGRQPLDVQASLGYSGSEAVHMQKVRHRDFQHAAFSANRSKATYRRGESGSTGPAQASARSQYSSLQPKVSSDAAGATAYIDAKLKDSLAAASQPIADQREAEMASSISAVLQKLAPTVPDRSEKRLADPWHEPLQSAPCAQAITSARSRPAIDAVAATSAARDPPAPSATAPSATAPAAPPKPQSRSAVESLPCSSLDDAVTGLGAVDTLRSRLHRPAQPFPAQVEIDDTPPLPGMRPRSELIYDEDKEAHRAWRRYVYDFDYWANDRSAARFFFGLLHLPATRILRDVLGPTLFVTAVAAVRCSPSMMAAIAAALDCIASALPGAVRAVGGTLTTIVCGTPMELTAGFVGLLVAFRLNNAAVRFDEARKQLATMLNATRDAVRLIIATLPASAVEAKANFARWVITAFVALQCQLRIDDDLEQEVDGLLTDAEQDLLFSSDHPVRPLPANRDLQGTSQAVTGTLCADADVLRGAVADDRERQHAGAAEAADAAVDHTHAGCARRVRAHHGHPHPSRDDAPQLTRPPRLAHALPHLLVPHSGLARPVGCTSCIPPPLWCASSRTSHPVAHSRGLSPARCSCRAMKLRAWYGALVQASPGGWHTRPTLRRVRWCRHGGDQRRD